MEPHESQDIEFGDIDPLDVDETDIDPDDLAVIDWGLDLMREGRTPDEAIAIIKEVANG